MRTSFILLISFALAAHAELAVPASTAYLDPDPNGAKVTKEGIRSWTNPALTVSWFGEIKAAGKLEASVAVRSAPGTKFKLTVGGQAREATASESEVKFGEFTIARAGYVRFTLSSTQPAGEVDALVLNGAAAEGAHFNLDPRRNAASVHLFYPTPKDADIDAFYIEATGVEEPVHTFYMAAGFNRGYFGMQVNSPAERRIIFSVWDSGAGGGAMKRDGVAKEDHVQLIAKGDDVHASVFGGEGTGGHSHLKFLWKTGEPQRFLLTSKPLANDHVAYTGRWFHPERKEWVLIASFDAPKAKAALRGLHSFSENFSGSNGHLRRKALYGAQWMHTRGGTWTELTEASFSHDGTGKTARLDRFMGVESGRHFLSHGGFVEGFTKYGDKFSRPATGKLPSDLPPLE